MSNIFLHFYFLLYFIWRIFVGRLVHCCYLCYSLFWIFSSALVFLGLGSDGFSRVFPFFFCFFFLLQGITGF